MKNLVEGKGGFARSDLHMVLLWRELPRHLVIDIGSECDF